MDVKEFESVKKWFASKTYKESTIRRNLKFCADWCEILGKTPDEIVKADPVDSQNKIAEAMENNAERYTINVHLSTFHQFLRANGVFDNDPELEEIVLNVKYPTRLRTHV